MKGKQNKDDSVIENIKELFKINSVVAKDKLTGQLYFVIKNDDDTINGYLLGSSEFTRAIKKRYFEAYGSLVNTTNISLFKEMLEVKHYDTKIEISVVTRVYNDGKLYAYELNKDTNTLLVIQNGEVFFGAITEAIFKHPVDYANQVEPDLEVEPTELFGYMKKHFKMEEWQLKLLTLYLVTSYMGLCISHPLLVLCGEKGSSKSTSLKKLEMLVDPKSVGLGCIPKNVESLDLRLANSYYVTLDNLSTLSRSVSDTLARAVTGGSVAKRKLYSDNEEILLNIKSLVAINGVTLVAKESDLLDRALILTMQRISPDEVMSDEKLWEYFEEDRPAILGCCFKILAEVLEDNEPVYVDKLIRMADFHIACIKVGRALGWDEEEVNNLLWKNQETANKKTIDEDIVALAVIELMNGYKDNQIYQNSVSGLLSDLRDVLARNEIDTNLLPKLPNKLSNRLSKVASSLKAEHRITYSIKNVGTFKQITIVKSPNIINE